MPALPPPGYTSSRKLFLAAWISFIAFLSALTWWTGFWN